MKRHEIFEEVIRKVREIAPDVKEIWFHGSRAEGKGHKYSDWDFLAVFDHLTTERRIEFGRKDGPFDRLARSIPGATLDIQAESADDEYPGSALYWARDPREGTGVLIWSSDAR
jgi:predicted nucleotidyltransferase